MEEWKEYKMSDLTIMKNGGKRPSSKGQYPVYGGNGIMDYTDMYNAENTIVVGRVGAYCGNVYYYPDKCWVSDNAIAVSANDLMDIKYLFYLMSTLNLHHRHIGCAQPLMTQDIIGGFNVIIPHLKVQKEVASILSSLDDKIELNRAINHNLEAMLQDITDFMFLSKKEKLPSVMIGSVADIKAGGDCPSSFSKVRTEEMFIPIFSNGTDGEGLYGYTNEPTILERSITIAARGTIGYCIRRQGGYVPIIRLLSVVPKITGGDTYLHQLISRMTFRKNGSVQQQLTVPELSVLEVPYPTEQQLGEYEKITRPLVLQIENNKKNINNLAKLRDELLALLMNGQVSVNYDL